MMQRVMRKPRRNPLNSEQILNDVAKLHVKDIDLGLDRFRTLLEKLGNPQESLPPVIHIAGTNGKGSTLAFLRAAFESVGYLVHSFTSPHLVSTCESINLAGEDIDEATFAQLLEEVVHANEGEPLTRFEALSAAAFLAFARNKGHVVLLETGLGGDGDTTNVITSPVLSILSPISLDHQEFLGDSLEEIATHKAGILKKDAPCVLAKQSKEAYQVIREKAKSLQVPLYREGREWFVKRAGDRMIFESWQGDSAWPLPGLVGEHQIQNAGVALAALEVLKERFRLPEEAVRNGLQSVHWPGRLERIPSAPFLEENWELWLDGGHNESAANALRQQFKKWHDKPLYLICGMMKRKNSRAFLEKTTPLSDHIYTVSIADQPCKKPEKLAEQVSDSGGNATVCHDIQGAFEQLKRDKRKPGRVLVCGSLYLLGTVYGLQSHP